MKKIAILGSTGSIGTQALNIIENNEEDYEAVVLSCAKKVDILCEQIEKFHPKAVCVANEKDAIKVQNKYKNIEVYFGEDGLVEVASSVDSDMLLNSLMGMRGLPPTYAAINAKKDIALANKETLVAGGEIVMKAVKSNHVKMLPVDSEHSAIFQSLQGNNRAEVSKILLTASGGPFRGWNLEQLADVKLEQALKHPNWNMGQKITIDSATMMNKGLEVIEAKWLFDIDPKDIEILVHKESIVHSMVEYQDGAVIAQLGVPDMRLPIALAFSFPNRMKSDRLPLNMFKEGANLTFEKPDTSVFKCIKLAYNAIEKGGSYPVILNSANEVLVEKFLNKEIGFLEIQNTLERVLDSHKGINNLSLDDIMELDKEVRSKL